MIKDPFSRSNPDGDLGKVGRTLRSINCAELSEALHPDQECRDFTGTPLPENYKIATPGFQPVAPVGPNPFATSMDRFRDKQYQDNSSPYDGSGPNTNSHPHSNPFSSYQNSAERDLTGQINPTPRSD